MPTALLPIAKSQLRIDGTYDDAFITDAIKRAIKWFERVSNISVNPITWIWQPDESVFCEDLASVPISPVNSFTVADAGAVDISASYKMLTMSTHGINLYALKGAYAADMLVTMPSGYADLDELDAGIADAVMRYTAHLYENREILMPGSEAQSPGWMSDVISTYWMPRV